MNIEKLLEKLCISKNWHKTFKNIDIDQTIYCEEKERTRVLVSFNHWYDYKKDKALVLKAPKLLCALIKSTIQFKIYAEIHRDKGNLMKKKANYGLFKEQAALIKEITGLSWEAIEEIAKE